MVGAITMTCNDSTRLKKGNSCYRKGRFYEAIDYYNLGLRENPYNTILQTKKGNALYRLGYIQQANDCFYLATTQAGAYEQLRRHVYQHYNNISRNLRNVQQMLKSRYNIPILQNPLKKFLISLKSQIKDQKEREEFEEFKKKYHIKTGYSLLTTLNAILNTTAVITKTIYPVSISFSWRNIMI